MEIEIERPFNNYIKTFIINKYVNYVSIYAININTKEQLILPIDEYLEYYKINGKCYHNDGFEIYIDYYLDEIEIKFRNEFPLCLDNFNLFLYLFYI